MKSILILSGLLALTLQYAYCEDWTIGAKTYQNVTVGQVEADCVHITYSDGIGSIKLADMPPDLQKRFGYNPAAAKQSETDKAKAYALAVASLPPPPKITEVTQSIAPAVAVPSIDKTAILSQIQFLQNDIAEKTAIMNKERAKSDPNGHAFSGNGYKDVISDDQARINALESQLH